MSAVTANAAVAANSAVAAVAAVTAVAAVAAEGINKGEFLRCKFQLTFCLVMKIVTFIRPFSSRREISKSNSVSPPFH